MSSSTWVWEGTEVWEVPDVLPTAKPELKKGWVLSDAGMVRVSVELPEDLDISWKKDIVTTTTYYIAVNNNFFKLAKDRANKIRRILLNDQ